jgi:hypothetical protein
VCGVAVSSSSSSSGLLPAISLFNVSDACFAPICRLVWAPAALTALHPLPFPQLSDIRAYFLGDQNGVVITTSKCFLLAVHKGPGRCSVKLQRLSGCDASVMTAGSTVSAGACSQVSDDGDGSVVMVGARASAAAAAVPVSGRVFKRSSVLGRVSWTLQLMNLSGSTLSYTNKDGKDKTYDLTGCAVSAPQVRGARRAACLA